MPVLAYILFLISFVFFNISGYGSHNSLMTPHSEKPRWNSSHMNVKTSVQPLYYILYSYVSINIETVLKAEFISIINHLKK
jgi:hypothetical protein